jgi:Na+/proline symporter
MVGVALYGRVVKHRASGNSAVNTHFLGGQDFGAFVIFFNTVASFVSGYFVVGIPQEASAYGYITMSWIGACLMCAQTMQLTWPRLQRIYSARGYTGPNDLISDRYNSRSLRLLTSLFGVFQLFMFSVMEWSALYLIVPIITDGDIDGKAAVWFLATIVLICEFIGGMTSVAITDAIQCCLLVASFFSVGLIFAARYGGFGGITDYHCPSYQVIHTPDSCSTGYRHANHPIYCEDFHDEELFNGCILCAPAAATRWWDYCEEVCGKAAADATYVFNNTLVRKDFSPVRFFTQTGCLANTRPTLLEYPTREMAWQMLSMTFLFAPASLSPMFIHRLMIAKDDDTVRRMFPPLYVFPFGFFLPSILIGITKTAVFNDKQGAVFSVMVSEMSEWGGFFAFVAILLFCSCICAFMSTADSIIIACSNTLVMDLWSNWLQPTLSHQKSKPKPGSASIDRAAGTSSEGSTVGSAFLAAEEEAAEKEAANATTLYITKATSLVLTYAAVAIALYSRADIQQLLNIGFGALYHVAPAYYGAIFQLGFHAKPLSTGMLVGLVVTIYAELAIQRDNNPHTNTLAYVFSCYWGFIANLGTVLVCELAIRLTAPQMLDDHGIGLGIDEVISLTGLSRDPSDLPRRPSQTDDDRRPSIPRRPSQERRPSRDRRPSQSLPRRPSEALASQYVNAWDAIEAEVKKRWGTEPLTPDLVARLMQKTVEPVLSFLHKEPEAAESVPGRRCKSLSCHRHPLLRYAGTAAWIYMQCCLVFGLPWWEDAWVEGPTPIGEYGVNPEERAARGEIQMLNREDTFFAGIPRWCAAYVLTIASGAFVSILSISFVWVSDAESRHACDGDDETVAGLTTMQKWLKNNQKQLARLPSHRLLRRLSEERLMGIGAFREAGKEVISMNRAVHAFQVGGSRSEGGGSGADISETAVRPKAKANQIMPANAVAIQRRAHATMVDVSEKEGSTDQQMELQALDAMDDQEMDDLNDELFPSVGLNTPADTSAVEMAPPPAALCIPAPDAQ